MQFTTALIAAVAGFTSVAMAAPTALEARYTGGQCGIHVTQYQKNENGVGGEYEFTVVIKDAVGAIIGGVNHQAVPDHGSYAVASQLPATLLVEPGAVDSDPVTFAYNGQVFSSSSGCSTGGYDSGSRQMDCGFQC